MHTGAPWTLTRSECGSSRQSVRPKFAKRQRQKLPACEQWSCSVQSSKRCKGAGLNCRNSVMLETVRGGSTSRKGQTLSECRLSSERRRSRETNWRLCICAFRSFTPRHLVATQRCQAQLLLPVVPLPLQPVSEPLLMQRSSACRHKRRPSKSNSRPCESRRCRTWRGWKRRGWLLKRKSASDSSYKHSMMPVSARRPRMRRELS
mmetsp:Transcript_21226/g.49182  ORF Transcript_21226/g.49182 Transcript_21226/m.49182 type:complete len:205 (+) Transcript_21226:1339-1953(+)